MQKKMFFLSLAAALLLCGCGKDDYQPFQPLSEATISPERKAELISALNGESGNEADDTENNSANIIVDPFYADMDPNFSTEGSIDPEDNTAEGSIVPEENPFAADPAPFETEPIVIPTATPLPLPTATATATMVPTPTPYDPGITMYGQNARGLTTYTLQNGDDLICLGRRFNISIPYLLQANQLESEESVSVGSTIVLPRTTKQWSMTDGYGRRMLVQHPAYYTIQNGDTLFSIACYFGDVKPEDIATTNRLVLNQPLPVGTEIIVP